jgi:hypothetical protein
MPLRESVVPLPTASLPLAWLARLARSLRVVGRRPTTYRFALNPYQTARVAGTALRLLATRAGVRAVVKGVLSDGRLRRAVSLPILAEDLIKMEILRCARRGLTREPAFVVEVSRHGADTVVVESRPDGAAASRLAGSIAWTGAVRRLIWNHSAVGMTASCEPWPGRRLTVGFLQGGIYSFEALPVVARVAPHLVASLLAEALDAPGASRPAA